MIAASILHLLVMCCPAAVSGFIIAVCVEALNTMPLRSRPHVAEERLEGFSPCGANNDSSPAIIFIGRVVNAIASPNHRTPNRIFRCWSAVCAVPMRSFNVPHRYSSNTAAIGSVSTLQVITARLKDCSTVASAPPQISDLFRVAVFSSETEYSQHSKCSIRYIDESRSFRKWRKYDRMIAHGCIISWQAMTSRGKG